MIGLFILAAAATATPVAKPIADLTACRSVGDAAARLACYDAATDAITKAQASKDLVVLDRKAVRETRHGLFGFSFPRIGFLAGRGDKDDDDDFAKLETTIATYRQLPYGRWRFTTPEAGTWETTEGDTRSNSPASGGRVLLERAMLGKYWVTFGPGKHSVPGHRVQ